MVHYQSFVFFEIIFRLFIQIQFQILIIQEWFGEVRERLTRTLNDKSFEHDTQSSTGSTTGDWFILFKKINDSRSLLPVWEGTSLHFRNRVIFAYVNVDTNPIIQKTFSYI